MSDKVQLTFSDIMQAVQASKDSREKMMSDMVTLINEDKHLLKMSRLNQDLTYYVIKHLIIARFFLEYWSKISVTKKMIRTKEYPFYAIETTYTDNTTNKDFRVSYRKFIEEILSLTISYEGQGRKEIMQIIRSAEDKLREDEYNKRGEYVQGINQ